MSYLLQTRLQKQIDKFMGNLMNYHKKSDPDNGVGLNTGVKTPIKPIKSIKYKNQ